MALVAPVIYGVSMLMITGGHVMAPLDDSYIHFQFAQRLSQGHFFEYTSANDFSSGATSFLYPFLLAPFFFLGFNGAKILIVTFLLGIIFRFITALFLYLTGRQLSMEKTGLFAALLFLLNGNLAWNYLSGMETGLFGALLTAGIYFFVAWRNDAKLKSLVTGFLFLGLASVTRPEGFIILVFCMALLFRQAFRFHGSRAFYILLFVIPFAAYMIIIRAQTGDFSTAGVMAKSVSAAPYYAFWEKAAKLCDNLALIINGYYRNLSNSFFPDGPMFPIFPVGALYPFHLFPPGAWILALCGIVISCAREQKHKSGALSIAAGVIIIGILAVTNSEVVAAHNFRYLAPFQPLFLLFAMVGLRKLTGLFKSGNDRIFFSGALLLVLLSLPSVFYWAWIYGENANDLFEQHRRTSWWIKDNTPADSVIGVTDTGIIGYFSERDIYDFVGLTTPNQAKHWRHGPGSAFEKMERLPPERRPDYIATFPFVWDNTGLLGRPVYQAPLKKNLTTMSNNFTVFQQDWSFLHSGDDPLRPPEDISLIDKLDVADIENENNHDYSRKEAAERYKGWEFPNPRNVCRKYMINGKWIADGGRSLSGNEEFRASLQGGKRCIVLIRATAEKRASITVMINGNKCGNILLSPPRENTFTEAKIVIPAEYIQDADNRIRLEFNRSESECLSVNTFHYWFYQ